jgi:hypothetical protein
MFDDGIAPKSPLTEPVFRSLQYGAVVRQQYQPTSRAPEGGTSAGRARPAIHGEIRQYFDELARLLRSLC